MTSKFFVDYYFDWVMKAEKSYRILTGVVLIVVVALVGYGFYCGNLNYAVAACIVVALFGVPLGFYFDRQKEKANPLNFENRRKALAYAAQLQEGSKEDFVKAYSSDMYEVLLDRGYIHELHYTQAPDDSPRWEITRLGQNYFNGLNM